uniref:Uncharacterized protein n=1 Tax=Meloidogyne enterolobii TaxID=390850 RepID=A0A6V7U9X7_MELEN|nr:unnamed protein product [Meloidogyne enterolobii]
MLIKFSRVRKKIMIQNSSSKFQCELFILPPIFNSSTKNNLNELNIKIKQTFLFSPNLLENLFIPISLSEDNEKLNKNILKIFPEDILCSNRSCLGKDNSPPNFYLLLIHFTKKIIKSAEAKNTFTS